MMFEGPATRNTLRQTVAGLCRLGQFDLRADHPRTADPVLCREVLAEIKVEERLKRIPVVVLSPSAAEEDILQSDGLNASCYITKPIDPEEFISVVRAITDFWLTIVKLPPSE